ncbi:uncharacterized protein LOC144610397 [Rhinoraja longicauda]
MTSQTIWPATTANVNGREEWDWVEHGLGTKRLSDLQSLDFRDTALKQPGSQSMTSQTIWPATTANVNGREEWDWVEHGLGTKRLSDLQSLDFRDTALKQPGSQSMTSQTIWPATTANVNGREEWDWVEHGLGTKRLSDLQSLDFRDTALKQRLAIPYSFICFLEWKEALVWWIVATVIGCGWAYRGRTKDIIIYGCSGDTAPIATDGTGRREAEETAVHFHEGRWPGWLGSNSSEYSSASGFAYRDTSLLCPRVKIVAQRTQEEKPDARKQVKRMQEEEKTGKKKRSARERNRHATREEILQENLQGSQVTEGRNSGDKHDPHGKQRRSSTNSQ